MVHSPIIYYTVDYKITVPENYVLDVITCHETFAQALIFMEAMKVMTFTGTGLRFVTHFKCFHELVDFLMEMPSANNRSAFHKDKWLYPFRSEILSLIACILKHVLTAGKTVVL